MDAGTTAFYNDYAATLATGQEASRSAMLPFIEKQVPAGSAVLDVGAGSGRDVAAMLALGIDAFGIEPAASMRAQAVARYPLLQDRLRGGALPRLGLPFADLRPEGFDGVVCSAVLMHLPPADLPEALVSLVALLRRPASGSEGVASLLISIPEMAVERLQQDRDAEGRRFHNHAPARINDLVTAQGLVLRTHDLSDQVLTSTGTRWHTLVWTLGV